MEMKGKTALVTGGAHRVGRAISMAFAHAGANVVVNYHSSAAEAISTSAEIERMGVGALPFQADVSDPDQVQAMIAAANDCFGGVDVLVNSASIFVETPIPTKNFELWHKVTNILLDGAFYCSNAVAPHMLDKGEGAIIFIVDLSAWEPWPSFAAHSVGKAGLLALSRQLALEFAPSVRVNAVAPGPVLPPPDYSPERIEATSKKTLLNRWGKAEDVADAVLFLAKADYITGDVIAVDGGERFGHRKYEAG
jgi:NAD(P)-dependent dehydrogenase (short-subunit alcohol dehydrogenase family)